MKKFLSLVVSTMVAAGTVCYFPENIKSAADETINPVSLALNSEKTCFGLSEVREGNAKATVYVDSTSLFTNEADVLGVEFNLKPSEFGVVDPINFLLCNPNAFSTDSGNEPGISTNPVTSVKSIWDKEMPDVYYRLENYAEENEDIEYSDECLPYLSIITDSTRGDITATEENSDNHVAEFEITIPDDAEIGTYTIELCNAASSIGVVADGNNEKYYITELNGITFKIVDDTYSNYLTVEHIDEDNDGTYDYVEIVDCDTSAVSIKIPSTIDGLPVKKIGESAFYFCQKLEYVDIPESIEIIDEKAFYLCRALKKINIPDSVTNIGSNAFSSCSALKEVTLGKGLSLIEENTFLGCTNLESVNIPENVATIGYGAFKYCEALKSISLPDSVTTIGTSAFEGCLAMENLNLGNSLKSIGYSAFSSCQNLKSIEIPPTVEEINDNAFSSCTSLESIVIPDNVTYIGEGLFRYCTSLTEAEFGNGVTKTGQNVFENCTSLKKVIFGKNITEVGAFAFKECTTLETIEFPENIKSIEMTAFNNCTSLKQITIPESMNRVGFSAFLGCTNLTDITIKNPSCEIYDSTDTISDTAVIYGYINSTAEKYAEKYKRKFVSLGESTVVTTTLVTTPALTTQTSVTTSTSTGDSDEEKPSVLLGDANLDGKVNVRDCAFIASALSQGISDTLPANADYNEDNKTNVRDAAAIAAALAKGML